MGRRSYAGGARALTLTAPITDATILLPVSVPVSWPDGSDGPFSAVIARGDDDEEKVLCDTIAGGFLSVLFRGYDGTTAQAHNADATIEHVGTAVDFDEANDHTNSSVNVHGLIGGDQVVGETKTATLRNKSMSGSQNTFTNIPLAASAETAAEISNLHGTDVTLQNNIDNEATSRTSADASEATARAAADTTLQANIAAEASARIATDTTKADKATTYTKTEVDTAVAGVTPKVANQSVSATSNAVFASGPTVILTLASVTLDGATAVDVVASFDSIQGSQDDNRYVVGIYRGATKIATQSFRCKWNTDNVQVGVHISVRDQPIAGAYIYSVQGSRNVGTGQATLNMGDGSGGNVGPGTLRLSQPR